MHLHTPKEGEEGRAAYGAKAAGRRCAGGGGAAGGPVIMTVPGGAAWPGGTNIVGGGITGGASPLARASRRLRSRMATIWCNVFGGTWIGRTPPGTTMQGTGPPLVSTRTTCFTCREPGTGGTGAGC